MKILYIGFMVPIDEAYSMGLESMAGNNLENEFIDCLIDKYSINSVKCFTYVPIKTYPQSRQIFIKKRILNYNKLKYSTMVPTVNLPLIKQVSFSIIVFTMIIKEIIKIWKHNKKEKIVLLTLNSNWIFSIPAYVIKKITSIKSVCFLIDAFYCSEKINIFRRLIINLSKLMFTKYDGIITICEKSVHSFAPNVPYISIIPPYKKQDNNHYLSVKHRQDQIKLLFSGSLSHHNGIIECIEAFKTLPDNFLFTICGAGELEGYISNEAQKNKRIDYRGLIKRDEAIHLQESSDILLIIRTQSTLYSKNLANYAFSYKLIEYMHSGKPIIATRVGSIPLELLKYLNIVESEEPISISKKIKKVIENYNESVNIAAQGKDFIEKNCTWEKLGPQIYRFLES